VEVPAASRQEVQEPTVLIAEQDGDQRLYAVESVRQGIYALCRLGDWVSLEDFGKPPTKAKKISHGDYATAAAHDSQWWRKAALDIKSSMREEERTTETQGIRLAMKPPPSRTTSTIFADGAEASAGTSYSQAIKAETVRVAAENVGDEPPQPTETDPVDVYGMIRTQYLELLYIKKVNSTFLVK